jgi:glycolate oxidase FAD binding subunit
MADISVRTEAEVVEAVREARERRRTLEIVGAGTKRAFGRPTQCDDILDVSGLRGIVSYQPEELLLTVLPGTPVTEINELLSANGQRLGFEPGDWGPLLGAKANAGTIGGAISADVSGPAAVRYGRARDHLLGYRAVNGFAEAYKAGGKVVKNVTGFDLPKLMCGAFGTLGVLTEVTLRVFPKAEISNVFSVGGVRNDEAFDLIRRIWSSPLEATGLLILPDNTRQYFPEIISAETEEFGGVDDGNNEEYGPLNDRFAIIRLEGSHASLKSKQDSLNAFAGEWCVTEIADGTGVLARLSSGTAFVDTMEDVWLFSLPPSAFSSIASRSLSHWVADWAGGRLWERGTPGYDGSWHREIAAKSGGTATLVRASEETRKRTAPFQPEPPARAALTRAVKAAFDPLGIFNPGRMYEGI